MQQPFSYSDAKFIYHNVDITSYIANTLPLMAHSIYQSKWSHHLTTTKSHFLEILLIDFIPLTKNLLRDFNIGVLWCNCKEESCGNKQEVGDFGKNSSGNHPCNRLSVQSFTFKKYQNYKNRVMAEQSDLRSVSELCLLLH